MRNPYQKGSKWFKGILLHLRIGFKLNTEKYLNLLLKFRNCISKWNKLDSDVKLKTQMRMWVGLLIQRSNRSNFIKLSHWARWWPEWQRYGPELRSCFQVLPLPVSVAHNYATTVSTLTKFVPRSKYQLRKRKGFPQIAGRVCSCWWLQGRPRQGTKIRTCNWPGSTVQGFQCSGLRLSFRFLWPKLLPQTWISRSKWSS